MNRIKKYFITAVITMLLFSSSCYHDDNSIEIENEDSSTVKELALSSQKIMEMKLDEAIDYFKSEGFNNIKTIQKDADSYDQEFSIKSISIGNKRDFPSGSSFKTTSEIVIYYYERNHSEWTYNGIEYELAYEFHDRSGYSYILFDLNSNNCLDVGLRNRAKDVYSMCTYEYKDGAYYVYNSKFDKTSVFKVYKNKLQLYDLDYKEISVTSAINQFR